MKSDSTSPVSPNGRWIAYHSNTSGRIEIFVERYPELGNQQQISVNGGRLPVWSRDGKELFFISLDSRQMLAVQVQSGTMLVAAPPKVLFEIEMLVPPGGARTYDVAPDGRFLIIRSEQAEAATGSDAADRRRAELVRRAEAAGAGELNAVIARDCQRGNEPGRAHSVVGFGSSGRWGCACRDLR